MPIPITECPACSAPLGVTELSCSRCDTRLKGVFAQAPLARLGAEHQRFVEVFLLNRGVIRDVERALAISYPTVRARLDTAVAALESIIAEDRELSMPRNGEVEKDALRRDLLLQVRAGQVSPAAAAEKLRKL